MVDTNLSSEPTPLIEILRRLLVRAELLAKSPKTSQGALAMWVGGIRSQLEKSYGKNSPIVEHFPRILPEPPIRDIHGELEKRVTQVRRMVEALEFLPQTATAQLQGKRITFRFRATAVPRRKSYTDPIYSWRDNVVVVCRKRPTTQNRKSLRRLLSFYIATLKEHMAWRTQAFPISLTLANCGLRKRGSLPRSWYVHY